MEITQVNSYSTAAYSIDCTNSLRQTANRVGRMPQIFFKFISISRSAYSGLYTKYSR